MRGKLTKVLAAGLLSVGLAACNTQPATNVTATSAELNASGFYPGAPALDYWFEYAPASVPLDGFANVTRTPGGRLGAGSYGTVTAGLRGLKPATKYHYRVCGRGAWTEGDEPPAGCLNTQTFTTDTEPKSADTAQITGYGTVIDQSGIGSAIRPFSVDADLRLPSPGADIEGPFSFSLALNGEPFSISRGRVACLVVRGKTAVIGGTISPILGSGTEDATFTFFLTDNGGEGADVLGFTWSELPDSIPDLYTPPADREADDCSPQKTDEHAFDQKMTNGRIGVFDGGTPGT